MIDRCLKCGIPTVYLNVYDGNFYCDKHLPPGSPSSVVEVTKSQKRQRWIFFWRGFFDPFGLNARKRIRQQQNAKAHKEGRK